MKKRIIMLAAVFSAVSFFNQSLNATPVTGDPPVEIRLIGYEEEQPIFQVTITNTLEDVFTISFRFDNGDLLYIDRIKEKYYSQRFRMNIENLEDVGLRLEIKSKITGKTEIYEIKKSTKYLAETSISRLK